MRNTMLIQRMQFILIVQAIYRSHSGSLSTAIVLAGVNII